MKKSMLLGSALLVLSSSAFASQARLLALGMNEPDNDGSYYIQDSRNIFLNPAYVNSYSNQLMVDWGGAGQLATASAATTTQSATINNNTSAPKAQGGVFKKYGDFVYGAYFGNESNTSSLLRIAGSSALSVMNGYPVGGPTATDSKLLQTADNQIDLFLAGDNGLKWGVNALYASGKDESRTSKDSAAAARLGVIGSEWDAHLNLSLNSKSEASESVAAAGLGVGATTVTQEFKGKIGYQVGGSYNLNQGTKVFGYYKHFGWEQSDSFSYSGPQSAAIGGQNGTVQGDFSSYTLGIGNTVEVNNGDKVYTSLSLRKTDVNLEFANKSEVRHMTVPVTLGYEAKANEWLTLRGSVVQNIFGQRDNKNINNYSATGTRLNRVASAAITNMFGGSGKASIANSTSVNAGATLAFGQLSIDGLIGMTDSTGNAVISATNSNPPKTGLLSLSNLATSVGLTYKF